MAHLVFAETHPNAEKPKEPFFCQRTDEQSDNNSNTFYLEKRYIQNIKSILAA